MSKTMILNGSPLKNGNTSTLTSAFTKGAENVGHTVSEFHLDAEKLGASL